MPQPKSSSGRARKAARSTTTKRERQREEENVAKGLGALRDALTRAVMLPTERVREAMDDAVRRGRMTRGDAEELAQSLIAAGRRQTEELLAVLESLVGKQKASAADVRKRTRAYAEAQATEVVEPSPDRIAPLADHPGAPWQVLPYERQLEVKHAQVVEALTLIGKLDADVAPIVPAVEQWHYRNKAEFSF